MVNHRTAALSSHQFTLLPSFFLIFTPLLQSTLLPVSNMYNKPAVPANKHSRGRTLMYSITQAYGSLNQAGITDKSLSQ